MLAICASQSVAADCTNVPANDLKHVGCRGLLSERLAQLTEQPHILDRDGRLIREGFQQLFLCLRDRSGFSQRR
jgi:hypothetical protein